MAIEMVKPLEWEPYPYPEHAGPDVAVAHVKQFAHRYQVQRDPWAPTFVAYLHPTLPITDSTMWWQEKGFATLDAAKAAAQADYEQRILSALVPRPSPDESELKPVATEGEIFEAVRTIIYKRVSSEVDTHFIDRIHLRGVPDAAAEIAALFVAAPRPYPSAEPVQLPDGVFMGEFKPCVIVNEETGTTEAIFEDTAYVAVPVFDGIHHYMDKHIAMDDGRLVGFEVWQTTPATPASPSAELVDQLMGHSCGCGGACGQRTPAYISKAASELTRLADRLREAEAQRDEGRCPIGLDKSPSICSAGTCDKCHALAASFYMDNAKAEIFRLKSRAEAAESRLSTITAERDELIVEKSQSSWGEFQRQGKLLAAAEARAAALAEEKATITGEVERLRKALMPFTLHYAEWMDRYPDDTWSSTHSRHTYGQLRAAIHALTTQKGDPDADR